MTHLEVPGTGADVTRVMIYSQDSHGLGHLRRTSNLANAMVAQREDVTVLMIVDSPVAPFFELHERIDFVKLPTVIKVDAGVFRPDKLLTSYDMVREMRSNLLKEITRQYCPHLLLVDHMPGGANRELVPALQAIRDDGLPTKIVLGLRDIIDKPEVTRDVWRREQVYETIEDFYDHVMVYGSADVFPTAEVYGLSSEMAEKVEYCGYVCNQEPAKDPHRIREKFNLDEDELIVAIMAGGGADAFLLMRTFLDSVAQINGERRFAPVMVTGPFMPEAQRKTLRDDAKAMGVRIHTSMGDTLSQINAAHVVVSMAGYNTLSEILRFQKRAIIVPRPGPSAEQRMRAGLFADRGLIRVIDQDDLTADSLASELSLALGQSGLVPESLPCLDGVSRGASMLLRWLSPSPQQKAPAAPPIHAIEPDPNEPMIPTITVTPQFRRAAQ